MENHFVCSECGFTSKLAGTCQNDNCIRQGTRLTECHCEDGTHAMIMRPTHDELTENIEEQTEDAKRNGYSTNTLDLDSTDDKQA
jgi:hypothetical protein